VSIDSGENNVVTSGIFIVSSNLNIIRDHDDQR